LAFRNDKVSKEEIIASINEAGHDVKDHLATDEQYANIHGCCKFRDAEQRKAHGLEIHFASLAKRTKSTTHTA
jgi:mercuric ion binding protein